MAWIPLFLDVAESDVHEALADCEVIDFPAGTKLLRPGEINQSIYIPLSGNIAAHLDADGGADTAIPIPMGELLGELSATDGKPVSALVVAMTDVRVLKLSAEIFWNRLMPLPSVARNFRRGLSERMRRTSDMALKAQREQLELQHLRKELDVARSLQVSMLPLQRPMFADRSDIDVCGFMEPASNVGGDLFDAFFVARDRLFLCIGDVSGHGIASALFMARTIGLLRVLAMGTHEPDALLVELNNRLCLNNDTNLFITLFCGFLDVATGALTYSNGGHCPPILSSASGTRYLPIPKGMLVGAFPDIRYTAMRQKLAPGDTLFCYTDGVTEAQSAAGEEFGEGRCLDLLGASLALPLPGLLDTVRAAVARFTGTELLDDDCTMLALRHQSNSDAG